MLQYLIQIARDWATRSFGVDQMIDPKTRALRLVEESIEFAQAVGVEAGYIAQVATNVYSREPGDPYQELGGVYVTAHLAASTCAAVAMKNNGTDAPDAKWGPEHIFVTELRRVLAKEARKSGTFAKRNAEKINLTPGYDAGVPSDANQPHYTRDTTSHDHA